jgi:hypothetical protein
MMGKIAKEMELMLSSKRGKAVTGEEWGKELARAVDAIKHIAKDRENKLQDSR